MGKFEINTVSRRRFKKIYIPVAILIIIVGLIWLGVRNLNAPAVGTISQTPTDKAEVKDPYANPGTYNGQYISFTYPTHYRKVPSQKTGSYLEVAGFFSTDQTSKQISVGVIKEGINDDSGVKLRRSQPDKYHEEPRTASGVVIFSSTANGSEQTAYVPHQDKVATVSVTAPPDWNLTEDLQTILSSLRWK